MNFVQQVKEERSLDYYSLRDLFYSLVPEQLSVRIKNVTGKIAGPKELHSTVGFPSSLSLRTPVINNSCHLWAPYIKKLV